MGNSGSSLLGCMHLQLLEKACNTCNGLLHFSKFPGFVSTFSRSNRNGVWPPRMQAPRSNNGSFGTFLESCPVFLQDESLRMTLRREGGLMRRQCLHVFTTNTNKLYNAESDFGRCLAHYSCT